MDTQLEQRHVCYRPSRQCRRSSNLTRTLQWGACTGSKSLHTSTHSSCQFTTHTLCVLISTHSSCQFTTHRLCVLISTTQTSLSHCKSLLMTVWIYKGPTHTYRLHVHLYACLCLHATGKKIFFAPNIRNRTSWLQQCSKQHPFAFIQLIQLTDTIFKIKIFSTSMTVMFTNAAVASVLEHFQCHKTTAKWRRNFHMQPAAERLSITCSKKY